jgi:SET domain-containing protein
MSLVSVRNSEMQGRGVFSNTDFQVGEVVLEIDDSHVVTDETLLTPEQHEFDLDYVGDKTILMQSPEKFINHSCDPNTYVKTFHGVRTVLAMKPIKKDEEITYDYAINGDNDGTFECHCGSRCCRGVYQGDFFKLSVERQREYLPFLDDWFVEKHRQKIQSLRAM